ncbi:MAG: orotidine-5'-phosphate decarboxylase [Clostridia bacterium]|nr:orotidine-5'-phosphate decarboxylase [Clostridia bacterium]
MKTFSERLTDAIRRTGNPTVMGLDPMLSYLPDDLLRWFLEQTDDPQLAAGLAIFEFNRRLIDQVSDLIPAVKPQLAYYEQYGLPGIDALRRTIEYAREKGLLVIADGKRNDIGSTAEAYARAWLGETTWSGHLTKAVFAADALTVNAYLGSDGVTPFSQVCAEKGKGLFVLVRTSNPSAGELQDLRLEDGRTVYQAMADQVSRWGEALTGPDGYSAIGAVVGATWPRQAAELRGRMHRAWILVPGYGAQGGSADDTMPNFQPDGLGAIVNASRSLMCAWQRHDMPHEQFDLAARREAIAMRDALTRALAKRGGHTL